MKETDELRKGLNDRGIKYTVMDWRDKDAHTMFELRIGGVTCVADYYESKGRFGACRELTIRPIKQRYEDGHKKVLELVDGVIGRE